MVFLHTFRLAALELAGEEVSEPPLKEGDDPPEEEEPHPPAGRPEPTARTLREKRNELGVAHIWSLATKYHNNRQIFLSWHTFLVASGFPPTPSSVSPRPSLSFPSQISIPPPSVVSQQFPC